MSNWGRNQLGSSRLEAGDTLSLISNATEESRAALRTKGALIVTHRLARSVVEARRAFRDFERFRRHIDNCDVGTAACPLTIPAVAVKHCDRFGSAFVADRAARATASEKCRCRIRGHSSEDSSQFGHWVAGCNRIPDPSRLISEVSN